MSDISLPKEDSYALIQKVKSKAKQRGQVVLGIAVTGYVHEKICERSLSAGFDLWFAKPLDIDEFVAVLVCLAICQQSSYAIAQRILGHVPRHGDLSLEQQLEPSVSS
ncbi:response regulator [Nostoc sp. FACHB-280]|uniref:response regulator n=1 Tax=Nostoc sp. FACHB-280 TaxID=2692839 RepID=UPI001F559674|nr:response regulator [Nostoc sp. FACHB-280]